MAASTFSTTLANDDDFPYATLEDAARGSYVNENDEVVASPFGFAMADHDFRSSTFRDKEYTMYSVRGNSIGPISDVSVAFVNKTEDAKTRGSISFVMNLPDGDMVKAIDDCAAQIESAARGKSKPPNGIIMNRKNAEPGKKKARPTKAKLILPEIESHEIAGVVKEKKIWPKFHTGTKTNQSNTSDKEYYSLEVKFNIPVGSMSELFRLETPWYKGTRCPNDFNFLDIVTSQSPEMTRFNAYIAPAFLMKVEDSLENSVHWVLKWKLTALDVVSGPDVTSTTPTLGLSMISKGEWDDPVSKKRPLEYSDDDSDDDDSPLRPPKLVRQTNVDG
jgi:hypothetical protein